VTPEPAERTATSPRPYAERLRVPWWAWPSSLLLGAVLAAEFPMGWLPFAIVVPLTVLALLWIGRLRVAVTPTEFQVDDARLPLSAIAEVVALDANGKLELLGVGANPLAFVVQRPWIGGAVQVLLDDPADPTPYWVVSTRHPVELATALLEARRP
jgi:DUF3093 family protein